MCGSLRSPPECSKQRFPAATPHVGQETASKCLGIMSLILIRKGYLNSFRKAVRFETLRKECSEMIERSECLLRTGFPSASLTQCLIDAVVSMGPRNTQLEPTLH
jgi:hypothetical protein